MGRKGVAPDDSAKERGGVENGTGSENRTGEEYWVGLALTNRENFNMSLVYC